MRQEVYEDSYGFGAWEKDVSSRCFVHILNSVQYLAVCGVEPPTIPPTAIEYTEAGLPWFDYYGGDLTALEGLTQIYLQTGNLEQAIPSLEKLVEYYPERQEYASVLELVKQRQQNQNQSQGESSQETTPAPAQETE